jgi:hypothetical protein
MQQSDLDGIERSGALARTRCFSYFDNPWLLSDLPYGDVWETAVSAWWAGWMREDAGRDRSLAQLMRLPMW